MGNIASISRVRRIFVPAVLTGLAVKEAHVQITKEDDDKKVGQPSHCLNFIMFIADIGYKYHIS